MEKVIEVEQQNEEREAPPPLVGRDGSVVRRVECWITRRVHVLAAGLLLVAALYRLLLLAHGWPALDSDEGVTGLVARHIALQGEHPTFFWGEHYLGAFESYFAVPFLTIFGFTVFALHLSVMVLTLAFLALMYLVGRAAYGPLVGLTVLAWLTLGPIFGVQRELMAGGGYQEILLLGAVIVLGVWERLRHVERLPATRDAWLRCSGIYAAIGLAAGLALWSDLLILPTVLIAVAVLCVVRTREVFSRAGCILALTFVLAIFPYAQYNLTHHFASYTEAAVQSNSGQAEAPTLTSANLAARVHNTLLVSLPALFGSPAICSQADVAVMVEFIVQPTDASHRMCRQANRVFSLSLLALYVFVAWQLLSVCLAWLWARLMRLRAVSGSGAWLRARWGEPCPRTTDAVATSARLWLRMMLLAGALATLLAYLLGSRSATNPLSATRYLLPMYLSMPLIFGPLWEFAAQLSTRLRRNSASAGAIAGEIFTYGRGVRAVVALVGIAVLLAMSVYGARLTLAFAQDTPLVGNPAPSSDLQALAFMDAHQIHTYCGAEYWVTYRLIYESQERVVGVMCGPDSIPPLDVTIGNRYLPYIEAVRADPRHAYLTYASAGEEAAFAASNLPKRGMRRAVTGMYAIYYWG